MKSSLENVKSILLPVYGREQSFSEEELIELFEKFFPTRSIFEILDENQKGYEVRPFTINQKIFLKECDDKKKEFFRLAILKAFEFLDCNPHLYLKSFQIVIPKKEDIEDYVKKDRCWAIIGCQNKEQYYQQKLNLTTFIKYALEQGYEPYTESHMTDWIEFCLFIAQRISNQERTWDNIFYKDEVSKVLFNGPEFREYGRIEHAFQLWEGENVSTFESLYIPPMQRDFYGNNTNIWNSNLIMNDTVPLVTISKK